MKIDGICAIVTGAAGGIGKAVVERLLSKGPKVTYMQIYVCLFMHVFKRLCGQKNVCQ